MFIYLFEKINIPNLELLNEVKEIALIEGYPEQASLKDNNTKECPCIDSEYSEDILNQMEDTKCKHFSQKISSGIL
jgi:hypothetical protein